MYVGFGEFYDTYLQDELYKSYAQRSSIRTTSREFTYYRTRVPILLSDFVTFNYSILARRCRKGYTPASFSYIGRVIGIGRDFRTGIRALGQVVLQVQELFYLKDLLGVLFNPPLLRDRKIVLLQNNVFFYSEQQISRRFDVRLDYIFGNDKLIGRLDLVFIESLVLRRIVNIANSTSEGVGIDTGAGITVTPLCLNYPVRGKLEI